jgi:hypothetical protein
VKSSGNAVPTNPAALSTWVTDFERLHGVPPIAGGEVFGPGVASAGQPQPPAQAAPPAPAPAQAASAAPAPAPAATPAPAGAPDPAAAAAVAASQGQPPQPVAGQPAAAQPGAAAAQAQPGAPDYVQVLLDRMDEIDPPALDPLAAELFGQPAQPPAMPGAGQQQLTPEQFAAAQATGLAPQSGYPQATPGQVPQAGQPAVPPTPGLPGQPAVPPANEQEYVDRLIDQRAQAVAQRMIDQRVNPYIQTQEANRRRSEAIALTQDYPEFRDPAYQSRIAQTARGWAQQILGSSEAAGEPGFLELCHLATKQLAAQQQETPAATASGAEVPIEAPGGANPGGAASPTDQLAAGIVAASPGRGLSPIWS